MIYGARFLVQGSVLPKALRFRFYGLVFGVWCLGFGVWGLGLGVCGLGFPAWGFGFRASGGGVSGRLFISWHPLLPTSLRFD